MATITSFISNQCKQILIVTIGIYRFAFSSLFGHCCRFQPTCSSYAIEAIKAYGCIRGLFMTTKRLLRCHPWQPGGDDPVPFKPINRSRI